jgi:hypothetical protein
LLFFYFFSFLSYAFYIFSLKCCLPPRGAGRGGGIFQNTDHWGRVRQEETDIHRQQEKKRDIETRLSETESRERVKRTEIRGWGRKREKDLKLRWER